MSLTVRTVGMLFLCWGSLILVDGRAQSFGTINKEKVILQRKLPALVNIPGPTVKVKATAHQDQADAAKDFETRLETELIKDNPNLSVDESHPATIVTCQITNLSHPPPTVEVKPAMTAGKSSFGIPLGKSQPKNQQFMRITGELSVSFQAKTAKGQTLISDNVQSKYDEEFDSSGNSTSHGVMGSFTGTLNRMKGGPSEDMNPPTDAELREKLMVNAIKQIASHLVDTSETLEIYLARGKGDLDEGDRLAAAGLWERALETFETAQPSPKPEDNAYRLYDIGVAYEALAYQAENAQSAMKFLDQAAINYGKAIDAKPSEKYFLDPQKRIETAIEHYKQLQEQKHSKAETLTAKSAQPAGPADAAAKPAAPKALTNAQVVAMTKSGMDDDTVIQTIRAAKATDFDLSTAGRRDLTTNGVSTQIVSAMQSRSTKKSAATK